LESLQWLKLNWVTFHATNIEGVIKNIQGELNKWNKENPKDQKLFINWIPRYGGKIDEEMVREQEVRFAKLLKDLN
jgi:C4-type Zn-finger protein